MWRNCSRRVYDCSWDSVEGEVGKKREGGKEGVKDRERENNLREVPSTRNK